MQSKSNQVDMTKGPLLTKIIAFAIPLMLTSMLQLLYNAADILVVGKFAGDASLAAVGSTGALISLIVNVFVGLSLGTGVVLSQAIGAKNSSRIHRIVHTSMLLSLFLGLLVGLLGFVLCKPLLILMSTPDNVLNKATLYMQIYF
ncbi:MAG: MATE family efflux transporter, partial [Acutalibacteraceae bacterium]|nr:MATE family efflux transporter [Acutalibacteraceae bacterium]